MTWHLQSKICQVSLEFGHTSGANNKRTERYTITRESIFWSIFKNSARFRYDMIFESINQYHWS